MENFNNIIKESVKNVNGGKVLKVNTDGKKLSIAVCPNKDFVNISLNKEYVVLTYKDAKDFMALLK